MNLLDQDILKQMDLNNNEKNNKTKKTVAILLSCIVVVIIVIVIIFFYMAYLESAQLSLTLDGQSNSKVLGLFTAHNDSYYVPIKSLASNLGFSSYNGEYGDKSEETSKCYIQNENEVINFSLNSNVIYKLNTTNTSDNYTYVYLSSPVIAIGGELYISAEDIPNAFNTTYSYDEEENTITMYTMSYLISGWGTAILDYGYTALSEDYENNKAILDNMVVVTDETGEYGVFNLETKSTTLECKYDSVLYQETTGNFIVESDDKYGIIGADKKTKISLNYDSIEMMDYDAELYLVERNGKYGIVNFDGNTILYTEYEEIGIDISDFEYNELKTGYILFDTLILSSSS